MGQLIDLKNLPGTGRSPRAALGRVFFDRREFRDLLDFYTRRVMSGEWRDYAIDLRPKAATFSVFRHSAEFPIMAITKLAAGGRDKGRYVLSAGPRLIERAHSLADLLAFIEAKPRLVWSLR